MLRIRFNVTNEDFRPVNWPLAYPYWCSGFDSDGAILISYCDNAEYIFCNWPEAINLQIEEVAGYQFTDRFPKPEWFQPDEEELGVDSFLGGKRKKALK